MADNYLEKRYEEVFGNGTAKKVVKHGGPSLNTLLVKNRSIRRFRTDAEVSIEHLRTIVEVNTRIASAMNRQTLRFAIVCRPSSSGPESDRQCGNMTGSGHPDYDALCRIYSHGQARRVPPAAFIVIFSTLPEARYIDIDLGISLQSMALKAVELGYNWLMMCNVRPDELSDAVSAGHPDRAASISNLHPLALLAVGKPDESAFLKPVSMSDAPLDDTGSPSPAFLSYYDKDGVHYVPKLVLDDILL